MSLGFTNTLAALAAVVLAFTSIGTIVTAPPAKASDIIVLTELT